MEKVKCKWERSFEYKLNIICPKCGKPVYYDAKALGLEPGVEGVFKIKCSHLDCGVVFEVTISDPVKRLWAEMESLPPEYSVVVDDHFWDMLM